jgi:hypothetical protein
MSTGEFVSIAGVLAEFGRSYCDIKVVVSIQCSSSNQITDEFVLSGYFVQ